MAIEHIEVSYRVVTPLFCGGATPARAEIRLPSFKGVLRWWWRALAWAEYGGDLARIRSAEDSLFGSAGGGQSRVVMRLQPAPEAGAIAVGKELRDGDCLVGEGARYLGYGVMGAFGADAGRLTRACLSAPLELAIDIRARSLDAADRALLLDALRAVGTLGGLGAKSRKGYGSLVLRSLVCEGTPQWTPPRDAAALREALRPVLDRAKRAPPHTLPAFTAFSRRARVVLVPAPDAPLRSGLALLDRVGREVMRYRSWGFRGRVLGCGTEESFRDDHDLMKRDPARRRTHPRRVVFGLPHNYGKGRANEVGPAGGLDRRASPLLIHVHECGDTPVAVLSFLPAVFLPGGDGAQISVGGTRVPLASDAELWQPVHDLLDRFLEKPGIRKPRVEKFGPALEVTL